MNEQNAVVGSNVLVLDTVEDKMQTEATAIEVRADNIIIRDDGDYAVAAELLKAVKRTQKQAKEYWEPLRKSAKEAYDNVLDKRKQMMNPLEKAEGIVKEKMAVYLDYRAAEQKKAEQAAKAEMEKKLAEAAQAESVGDSLGAEYAMAEAEVLDSAMTGMKKATPPKVGGVSKRTEWEIVAIDNELVPLNFCGVEIRPVDKSSVMKLINASKGKVAIPGIQYKKVTTISARG